MNKPTILIAFAEYLSAEFISTLSQELNFIVVSIITEGTTLIEIVESQRPDYLLLDTSLNKVPTIGILKRFERLKIETKIIFYSTSPDPIFLDFLNLSSSCGLIMKGCSIHELKMCLKSILAGKKVIYTVSDSERSNGKTQKKSNFDYTKLTERELEIYEMLSNGKTEKEMSLELKISPNTVKVHKGNIYRKLNLKGKTKTIKQVY
ncbi:response regulator transcription factor [Cellulophaga sp. BC115SP]|uniref:response regulator transcription factor n=1 Tax=Cellulophaga sp. BC115SP TaxID=2683263 RepID=UPI00141202F9|nr:response regulator transcription factor [Cellulophaga sp. BC115SP]NBB31596.1 hypothetical protein [Cellulophaga sp. BC115SP]